MLFCLMLCLTLDPAPDAYAAVGTWKGYIYAGGHKVTATLNLKMEDGKLTGTFCYDHLNRPPQTLQCRFKGDKLKIFAMRAPSKLLPTQLFFDGVVTGDTYIGKNRYKRVPLKANEGNYFRFKRVLPSPGATSGQQG